MPQFQPIFVSFVTISKKCGSGNVVVVVVVEGKQKKCGGGGGGKAIEMWKSKTGRRESKKVTFLGKKS